MMNPPSRLGAEHAEGNAGTWRAGPPVLIALAQSVWDDLEQVPRSPVPLMRSLGTQGSQMLPPQPDRLASSRMS